MNSSSFFRLASLAVVLTICGCGLTCNVAPSISGQPANQTAATGQRALFTVAASGSPPLSYTWLKNGMAIPGATEASYITPAVSSADTGSVFTVTVHNEFGTLTSNAANLTVIPSSNSNIRFVAPTGDDSNPGTIDQPYQTIQHCATTVPSGWTCEVRAGTYRETVTPNSGVTITAYNFENVVVDGSDPVTGWTSYQGPIYRAKVAMRSDDTNQIFVGSEMMTEARWPDGNDPFHVRWATARSGTNSEQVVDSSLPQVNWAGAKIHLWSGSDPFGHETGQVTSSENGRIFISGIETGTCPSICPTRGGYYYLFGTLAALDAEGEWYYDSSSETLYFMAPGKANPNTIDVRSKQRPYAFDLRGRSGVTVRNISIFASSIITDSSSTDNNLDRINAQYVSHFTSLPTASNDPSGSQFSILAVHESDSGIVIDGTGNTLQNSTISYSSGTGVALEGSGNTIRNNLIQYVDYVGDYASGIVVDGIGNTIDNNTINSTGRQAILINAAVNEDIGYNNLFSSMMLSRDGAAIYACCNQVASGVRIHHNWIHDTRQITGGLGDSYALAGVTFDNGSDGFVLDQNVVWRNQVDNILVTGLGNSGPNTNYVHNNTIPDSAAVIRILYVSDCTATRIIDNRVVVSIRHSADGSPCAESNNNSSAPGATEMTPTTEVGCNFEGCSSNPPPAIVGNSITPCPVTLAAGSGAAMANNRRNEPDHRFQSVALNCVHQFAPLGLGQ